MVRRKDGPSAGCSPLQSAIRRLRVEQAIARAGNGCFGANQEGYWWAELEADTTLESDYILYLQILGQLHSPKYSKLAKYIRDRQLADGGWNIFYGGPRS